MCLCSLDLKQPAWSNKGLVSEKQTELYKLLLGIFKGPKWLNYILRWIRMIRAFDRCSNDLWYSTWRSGCNWGFGIVWKALTSFICQQSRRVSYFMTSESEWWEIPILCAHMTVTLADAWNISTYECGPNQIWEYLYAVYTLTSHIKKSEQKIRAESHVSRDVNEALFKR